ncbi:GNAT family N-acetyltransferase [Pseudoalteromonas xiamenensis]|uniref:GNAT family N-acetyltransferase n=1 Tax=Pseudoalteromonas xiamenensis TaxID=882626 RepID=A0A975HMG1_9GAMM|nr:GNAT family N-acetyltransferase [Pseudoalteromonas xiamenensis]QTH71035.1 GNAT family N-acetyltransferase [Pseudoalteromonas xiamenensis]
MSKTLEFRPALLDEHWDRFVRKSPYGSVFSESGFLSSVNCSVDAFYVCKGNEVLAALVLVVDASGRKIVGHHDIIYDGIIYRHSPLNRAQCTSEQFYVQEATASFLAENYDSVVLKLHPDITDIRALQWHNYHNDKPKYQTVVRYTTTVDIAEFSQSKVLDELELYRNASVSRRQEIRYGLAAGVQVLESQDLNIVAHLYGKTMDRQGISFCNDSAERMVQFLSALRLSCDLRVFEARDVNNNVGNVAVFLLQNDKAYYLYGAGDPEMRDSHCGTAVIWQSFYKLAAENIRSVDLEGVNSPARGWFKLSFGGLLQSYFHIKL